MILKADLHIHTADDPSDRISYSAVDVIARAAELGYGALAITLHNAQLDPAPLQAYAAACGIVLIPGIERTIEGRHVVLLNFNRATEAVRSFDDLARLKCAEPAGLVIAPHPFFPASSALLGCLDRHADLFDAVEYNAMFTRAVNFNVFASRWARRHGKPMVGNGDVHRLEMLGTTYSLIDADPNAASICAAIKAGRVDVIAAPHTLAYAVILMTKLITGTFVRRRQSNPTSRLPADEQRAKAGMPDPGLDWIG